MERIRSYPYQIVQNYPMQVVMHGLSVVVGGDDGAVRIFDTTNYHHVEKLCHGVGTA